MAAQRTVTCIADCKAVLGEGPVWVERERALYWLDIKGMKLFRYDWDGGAVQSWPTPTRIGSIAPRETGGFVAGTDQGFAFFDPGRQDFQIIVHPEADRPTNRFNDGKLDRSGNFWAGTMDDREEEASGALYRLGPELGWIKADHEYRVTNGPAFSVDGRRMYHNDSARQTIYAFDLDADGNVHDRQIFARFGEGEGYPDGMTIDCEDHLWVAFWDGACLRRLDPSGQCVDLLPMPVQRPTSCTFGGPGLDHLFITSARVGLEETELAARPLTGGLFRVKMEVGGPPEPLFGG